MVHIYNEILLRHVVDFWSLSCVLPFMTSWTAIHQSLLSFYLLEFAQILSIESVMLYNHLILWCPLLLLPSNSPSINIFSSESALLIRWPKYWSFSFSISPSNGFSDFRILGLTGLISLQSKGLPWVFSSKTIWKDQLFSVQPSLWSKFQIQAWLLEKSIALTIPTFVGKLISTF